MMKMKVIWNGQVIGCFEAPYISNQERRDAGVFQFRGTYSGENTYSIQMNTAPCPVGYSENMFAYSRKDSATGIKYTTAKMAYDIAVNGQLAGRIVSMVEDHPKKSFFARHKNVEYEMLQIGSDTYQCYHVAKSGIGAWYCVYKNGVLVAEIKKTMQVVNELTNYKLYMVDDADKELLFVFPGIFQCKYYENYKVMENRNLDGGMESNAMQTRNSLPMNLRQEMLEKFDSDFPGRVS